MIPTCGGTQINSGIKTNQLKVDFLCDSCRYLSTFKQYVGEDVFFHDASLFSLLPSVNQAGPGLFSADGVKSVEVQLSRENIDCL